MTGRGTPRAWWLVFASTLAFAALITHDDVFLAGNDASRFALIESIVDHGETHIDGSRYRWTTDRITIEGRNYSNKPPALSVIGAGLYAALRAPLGLDFALREDRTVYWLTLLLVGVPTAWLVADFFAALGIHGALRARVRGATTLALAAGTVLTSFSGTLNNHTVTAFLLFAGFLAARNGQPLRTGALAALAVGVDIVPGLVFLPVLLVVLHGAAGRGGLTRALAALTAGAGVFVAVNLWIVGSPLPPKLVPGGVDHSSGFAASLAGVLLPQTPLYPLECLFGWHGFFSLSPVLLVGAAGLGRAAWSDGPLPRRETLWIGLACVVMIVGHATFVGSYGGWSYGFRYLIPIVPFLLFFVPTALEKLPGGVFAAALAVSVPLALIGAYHPWPPAYEQEERKHPVASIVTNPVGANAAAWLHRYFPGRRVTELALATFVSENETLRRRYLALFYRSRGDAPARAQRTGPAQRAEGATR